MDSYSNEADETKLGKTIFTEEGTWATTTTHYQEILWSNEHDKAAVAEGM